MGIHPVTRASVLAVVLISASPAASTAAPPDLRLPAEPKLDECLTVQGLAFTPEGKDTLTWQPSTCATAYGLERGWISSKGFDRGRNLEFNRCLITEIPSTLAVDRALPDPGEAFTYNAGGLQVDEVTKLIRSGRVDCGVRLFVDPAATGAGTGRSWQDAFTSLQAAVDDRWEPPIKELWVKGPIHDPTVTIESISAVYFLGGFQGTETEAWERQPQSAPTRWEGSAGQVMLNDSPLDDVGNLVVDGFIMGGGSTAIIHGSQEASGLVEIRNTRFERLTGNGIQLANTYAERDARRILVRDCAFDGSVESAVRYWSEETVFAQGRITRNLFEGAQGAIIDLTLRQYWAHSNLALDILANEFYGGQNALRVDLVSTFAGDVAYEATIGSNLIVRPREDAIALTVIGREQTEVPLVAFHRPVITGNTIVGAGKSGISCTVAMADTGPDSRVYCQPRLWDNLITGCGEYGFLEGPDDPAHNAFTEPILIGNDLFGNKAMYLYEGRYVLDTPQVVNALPGFRDNACFDPLYVNLAGNDFHLELSSPARDRGHLEAPGWTNTDLGGQFRIQGPAPELGAYELPAVDPLP